jgi:hypothetical protein
MTEVAMTKGGRCTAVDRSERLGQSRRLRREFDAPPGPDESVDDAAQIIVIDGATERDLFRSLRLVFAVRRHE